MLNFINRLINQHKQKKQQRKIASKLYQEILTASRNKFFYQDAKCKDNIKNRFELLVLHVALAQIQMKNNQQNIAEKIMAEKIMAEKIMAEKTMAKKIMAKKIMAKKIMAQNVFDIFLADIDNNLREIGVGDLAIPKRMKNICGIFYQRLLQYEKLILDQNIKITDNQNEIYHIFKECDATILCEYLAQTKKLLENRLQNKPLVETGNEYYNGFFSFIAPQQQAKME